MTRIAPALAATLTLVAALAAASCTTTPEAAAGVEGAARIEGTIAAIDLQPWTYDGNAVVQVEAEGRAVRVQLPARWNLCQAAPVDVEALAVGMRVQAVGAATDDGGLVVCQDASHRLVPVQ